MITSLNKHALVGFAVGFISAILVNFLPWMDKVPGRPANPQVNKTWIIGTVAWIGIILAWELLQLLTSKKKNQYISNKWLDSLADIVVGWVAFMLPWSVLVLGSYGGNLLRP